MPNEFELTDAELAEYAVLCADRDHINKISIEHNTKADLFFNQLRVKTGVYDKQLIIEGNKIFVR